jgi:hypothetical protein
MSVDANVSMTWDRDMITYKFTASWEWHDAIDLNSFRQGWANIDSSTWASVVGSGALWLLEGAADLVLDKAFDFDYPFVGVWHEDVTVTIPR